MSKTADKIRELYESDRSNPYGSTGLGNYISFRAPQLAALIEAAEATHNKQSPMVLRAKVKKLEAALRALEETK